MSILLKTAVIAAAAGLLALSLWVGFEMWLAISVDEDLNSTQRYQHTIELYKTGLIGVVVLFLGTIVPFVFRVSQERFARRKDALKAYSEVKTGVHYLDLSLATFPLAESARYIHATHVQLHIALLYPAEVKEFLNGETLEAWNSSKYAALQKASDDLKKRILAERAAEARGK